MAKSDTNYGAREGLKKKNVVRLITIKGSICKYAYILLSPDTCHMATLNY